MIDTAKLMSLKLGSIEYFYIAALARSFSKAASILGISQPSLSEAIKKLEANIGVPLINRESKRFSLTAAGEAFFTHAESIHMELLNIQSELSELSQSSVRTIHLGSCALEAEIIDRLYSFLSVNPDISVSLESRNMSVMTPQLEAGYFDLCIIPTSSITPRLTGVPFDNIEFGFSLPVGHALEKESVLTPSMLNGEKLLVPKFESAIVGELTSYMEQNHASPQIDKDVLTRNYQGLRFLVNSNQGLGLFPMGTGRKKEGQPGAQYTRHLDPPFTVSFSLSWRKDKYVSHSMKRLIEYLVSFST